jgi:hypothetical protein
MQPNNRLIALTDYSISVNAKYRIAMKITQVGIEDLVAHVNRVETHAKAMESNAFMISQQYENSFSWRVTYPIRRLHRIAVSILSKRKRPI